MERVGRARDDFMEEHHEFKAEKERLCTVPSFFVDHNEREAIQAFCNLAEAGQNLFTERNPDLMTDLIISDLR